VAAMAPGRPSVPAAAGLVLLAAAIANEAAAAANDALGDVFTDPVKSRLALTVSCVLLVALWLFVARSSKTKEGSAACPDTPERLKVFARWALQQIQDSKPDAHRQMVDDVIFTFATYAQRLQKGSGRVVRRAAVERLRVLVELLETPHVNRALRAVNWAWLREWDKRLLEPREARLRCTAVLPVIVCAAEVQRSERMRCSEPGSPGLSYIACWCTDFLDRPDVRAFLGMPAPAAESSSLVKGISFMTPGEPYSDESSYDEDEGSPDRRSSCADLFDQSPSLNRNRTEGGSGEFCDMPRRRFDGQEHCWDLADATEAMVRGEHYLEDKRKVHSKRAMLELVEVDLLKAGREIVNYAASPVGRIPQLRQDGDDRFFFIVNFRLHPIHLAIIWAVPRDASWHSEPEGILFKRFREMSNEERNLRVKVLPKVLEGPWLVKRSVPDRPGVVGKKLQLDYFVRDNCLEVSINCISSPAGRRLVQLMTGAARHYSIELFIIIEGQCRDELPERVLAGAAVFHGDLSKIRER